MVELRFRRVTMNSLLIGLVLTQAAAIPDFPASKWLNSDSGVKLSDYKGKVVVLHASAGFC
jgi:hypothetical protein